MDRKSLSCICNGFTAGSLAANVTTFKQTHPSGGARVRQIAITARRGRLHERWERCTRAMPNINDRKNLDATLPYYSYSINSEGTVQGGQHVSIRTFGWHLHVCIHSKGKNIGGQEQHDERPLVSE